MANMSESLLQQIFTCNKITRDKPQEYNTHTHTHTHTPRYGGVEGQGQFIKADQSRQLKAQDTSFFSSIKFVYR
jgi:hypothetical protein